MRTQRFDLERNQTVQSENLPSILAIANAEKEALGFIPEAAYEDAIAQRRILIVVASNTSGTKTVAGYILFGGVFPHATVQQIGIHSEYRRHGIGTHLLSALVSDLENRGFQSIKANVAADLKVAQSFYQKNEFEALKTKAGGRARSRTIIVRVRYLETDTLFSKITANNSEVQFFASPHAKTIAPSIYSIDLNVLFDLVKTRAKFEIASRLFGAALGHQIRIVVAPEFLSELKRTTHNADNDPILQMAMRLPRLPLQDKSEVEHLASEIHKLVFLSKGVKGATSEQARSDAMHLAQSALAGTSAFITSDKSILAARDGLISKFSINVASLDDLVAAIPPATETPLTSITTKGENYECNVIPAYLVAEYFNRQNVPSDVIRKLGITPNSNTTIIGMGIREGETLVAAAMLSVSSLIEHGATLFIHVSTGHMDRELFADCLLANSIRQCSEKIPTAIQLVHIPGQFAVRNAAKTHGFTAMGTGPDLIKFAVGRPLTSRNWMRSIRQIQQRTGILLPQDALATAHRSPIITIKNRVGGLHNLSIDALEALLGPTIIVWDERIGVIVPIHRTYADELLGTSKQISLGFIEKKEAAFLSYRSYVNSPRTARLMKPGRPIVFYESKRSGGRGAAVAVAKIAGSIVTSKIDVTDAKARRIVVEDIAGFSSTADVLLTTFGSVLPFPQPVPLKSLQKYGATGKSNLITATQLESKHIAKILDAGWPSV